jgi:hypothetical protein
MYEVCRRPHHKEYDPVISHTNHTTHHKTHTFFETCELCILSYQI